MASSAAYRASTLRAHKAMTKSTAGLHGHPGPRGTLQGSLNFCYVHEKDRSFAIDNHTLRKLTATRCFCEAGFRALMQSARRNFEAYSQVSRPMNDDARRRRLLSGSYNSVMGLTCQSLRSLAVSASRNADFPRASSRWHRHLTGIAVRPLRHECVRVCFWAGKPRRSRLSGSDDHR
jgi:hypothetical protein